MTWRSTINFAGIETALMRAVQQAVTDAAEHVLGESTKVVPIEEGTLSRSGRTDTTQDGTTVVAAISYGTPYAVRQHEDMSYRHDPGRTAKYLEGPLLDEAGTVQRIIGHTVGKALT